MKSKYLFFYLTFYLFLYNISQIPSDNLIHLYFWGGMPKIVRYLEIIILIIVFVIVMLSKKKFTFNDILTYHLILISFLSFILNLSDFNYIYYQFNSFFLILVPFIMLTIFDYFEIDKHFILNILKFWVFVILVSIIVMFLYQINIIDPVTGIKSPDSNIGLFPNAHIFGSILGVFSVYFFSLYIGSKKKLLLFISIFFLLISIYPSNEKVILLNFLYIIYLILYDKLKHLNIFNLVIAFITFCILITIIILIIDNVNYLPYDFRIFYLIQNLDFSELGIIKSWKLALGIINENKLNYIIGIGPGNYASVGAQQAFYNNIVNFYMNKYFYLVMTNTAFNSAYQIPFNWFTIILVENGIVYFTIYFYLFFYYVKNIVKIKINTKDIHQFSIKQVFMFLTLNFLMTGLFTAGEIIIAVEVYLWAIFYTYLKKLKVSEEII